MGQKFNLKRDFHNVFFVVTHAFIAAALFIACSPNSGTQNTNDNENSNASAVYLTAAYHSVALGGGETLTAAGGVSPYTFAIVSGGGTVSQSSPSTATFIAPSAVGVTQVRATDASGASMVLSITISTTGGNVGGLAVSPMNPTVGVNSTNTFVVSGGTPPYSYTVNTPNGGSFNGAAYTSPSTAIVSTVTITDSAGAVVVDTITVSGAASGLLCNGSFTIQLGGTSGTLSMVENSSTGAIAGSITISGGTQAINGTCSSTNITFTRSGTNQVWTATIIESSNSNVVAYESGTVSGSSQAWSGSGVPTQ